MTCYRCRRTIVERQTVKGRKVLGCFNYPECKYE
ncbi:topoisomerase DNA-binding C4 zinc finger domain-containing protein [Heliobacterium mobile]